MTLCPGAFSIFHWGLPDTAKGFICTMTASRALSPVLRSQHRFAPERDPGRAQGIAAGHLLEAGGFLLPPVGVLDGDGMLHSVRVGAVVLAVEVDPFAAPRLDGDSPPSSSHPVTENPSPASDSRIRLALSPAVMPRNPA